MAVEVELRPVDQDGVPIRVSFGKTTIGRGPFLRCSDKKVSRNHAVLELTEDGVFTITSTHVNPSYYVKEGREKSEVLLPDKPQKLENGDQISLLANTYVYEVVIKELASDSGVDSNDAHKTSVKEETKSTTSTDEEEEGLKDKKEKIQDKKEGNVDVLEKVDHGEKSLSEEPDTKTEMETEGSSVAQNKSEENDTNTEMRKRTLPDWLMNSATASLTKAEPAPVVTQRRPGRPRKNTDTSTTPQPTTPSKASTSANDNTHSPQARSTRAKKQINYYAVDDNDSDDDEFTTPKRKRSVGRSRDTDPDYASNALKKNSGDDSEKESPKRKRKSSSGSPTKRNRDHCVYGGKCYRKNPTHFKEYSHPGDSDYSSDKGEDVNDEEDEKPECEYGVDCFRKNPKHRREFKHTKKARPKREAAKLARYADGDSDVDEGEEDFLDDESDEYNPEESDDDTDEDVGRLAKEAKSFVRNKKMYKMPK